MTVVELSTAIDKSNSYKLLELSPDLLKAVEAGEKLALRAPSVASPNIVICTSDKTFKLRKLNQTNTLLLVRPSSADQDGDVDMDGRGTVEAFGYVGNYLEPVEFNGFVDFSSVPVYGDDEEDNTNKILDTKESLKRRSPICDAEFERHWRDTACVEINYTVYTLHDSVIHTVLSALLTVGMAQLRLDDAYNSLQELDEPKEVLEAVLRKFSSGEESYDLDIDAVVRWMGHYILKQVAPGRDYPLERFMEAWRDAVVVNTNVEFTLEALKGHYVQPTDTTVRFLARNKLSQDPRLRFKQLFAVKSTWELSEMVPFIDDLRDKKVKLESFVMKYARKRTVGSSTLISARNT
ncbi:sister chromatid cohesion protein Dcc1p [Trichomonascus vanleenenianus]|uniref:Dcc1p n=1 Tax=Trichomonascus vanleenenianus TaxID=2268995 RepID=UPI003ECB860C